MVAVTLAAVTLAAVEQICSAVAVDCLAAVVRCSVAGATTVATPDVTLVAILVVTPDARRVAIPVVEQAFGTVFATEPNLAFLAVTLLFAATDATATTVVTTAAEVAPALASRFPAPLPTAPRLAVVVMTVVIVTVSAVCETDFLTVLSAAANDVVRVSSAG